MVSLPGCEFHIAENRQYQDSRVETKVHRISAVARGSKARLFLKEAVLHLHFAVVLTSLLRTQILTLPYTVILPCRAIFAKNK